MELLLALRGNRSQTAWSRRLGYKSNVAYAWESGRRWPTASETLRAAARAGVDLRVAYTRFFGVPPAWLDSMDPDSPEAAAHILEDLRGNTSVADLARRADLSRYAVSRWLSAETQPRLPDFLQLVQGASLRMVDFVASIVDPSHIPTISTLWAQLEARRRGAFEQPWTQAVLRAFELVDYAALPCHQPGWVARRLGIPEQVEATCVAFLRETGQITWSGTHWKVEPLTVDTRRYPEVGRALKAHWTRVAADRLAHVSAGQFSYNVFTVSQADFERLRELHLAYFRELRAIVAESEPGEHVAVANVQLFMLDG